MLTKISQNETIKEAGLVYKIAKLIIPVLFKAILGIESEKDSNIQKVVNVIATPIRVALQFSFFAILLIIRFLYF